MVALTKLSYWSGVGTVNDPYKPDYANRYPLDSYHVRDNGRYSDGVVLVEYNAIQATIDLISADAGVISSGSELPTPDANALTMPTNPIDLTVALAGLSAGDTLTLAQGIYLLPANPVTTTFGPTPASTGLVTTIRPEAGARVVITTATTVPNIRIGNYVHLKNLWFGGNGGESVQMGHHCRIAGCTFYGYEQAIIEGDGHTNAYINNRFVNCGGANLSHAIYISGDRVGLSKNALIEGNIFINGGSYAIHLFHKANNCIIRRNLMASTRYLMVCDGDNHLVERNLFWSSTGVTMNVSGMTNGQWVNNIILYGTRPIQGLWTGRNIISGNRWVQITPHVQDSSPTRWGFREMTAALGRSYIHIEAAIAALISKFASFDATDGTIDDYFAVLEAVRDKL